MIKRLRLFAAVALLALAACATTGTPQERYIADAVNATTLIDQVTLAATAAVRTGALKDADALNTLAVVRAARDGLNLTKTIALTNPEQARSKLAITMATLTATQSYLATLGARK